MNNEFLWQNLYSISLKDVNYVLENSAAIILIIMGNLYTEKCLSVIYYWNTKHLKVALKRTRTPMY